MQSEQWQVTWRDIRDGGRESTAQLKLFMKKFLYVNGTKKGSIADLTAEPETPTATEVVLRLKQGVVHISFGDEVSASGFLEAFTGAQREVAKGGGESRALVPAARVGSSGRAERPAAQAAPRAGASVHDFELMSSASTLPKATGRGLSTPEPGDTGREAKRRAIESLALTAQETPEKPGHPSRFGTQVMRRAQPVRSGLLLERKPSEPLLSASYGGYRSQVTFGLKNLGNTCYLNAVVQAVRALREFVSDLRCLPQLLPGCKEGELYRSTLEILQQMSSSGSGTGPCNPSRLREHVAAASPMFSGSAQQDAHEFFLEYVNQLHDELLATRESWLRERGTPVDRAAVPATQLHMDSEVHKRLHCIQCQKSREVSERFRDFSVDFNGEPGADRCSLSSMVGSYFAGELLEAKCEHCGAATARMEKDLAAPPRVLVLHLKRFVPNLEKQRYDKRHQIVEIPSTFDLAACLRGTDESGAVAAASTLASSEVLLSGPCPSPARLPARPFAAEVDLPSAVPASPAKRPASEMAPSTPSRRSAPSSMAVGENALVAAPARAPGLCYSLRAIVAHDGTSPHSGHYVCYARGEEGRWRLYDDSLVRELAAGEEPQHELGRKAYIIFYVLQGQEGQGRAD